MNNSAREIQKIAGVANAYIKVFCMNVFCQIAQSSCLFQPTYEGEQDTI